MLDIVREPFYYQLRFIWPRLARKLKIDAVYLYHSYTKNKSYVRKRSSRVWNLLLRYVATACSGCSLWVNGRPSESIKQPGADAQVGRYVCTYHTTMHPRICALYTYRIYVCTTTFLGNTGWYVFARFWYILGKQVVKGSRRTMLLAAVLWSCCCCAAFCAVLCCCAALTDWLTQQMINSRIGVNQTLNNTRQDTWVSR